MPPAAQPRPAPPHAAAPDHAAGDSVDPADVARFAVLAERWWDPHGEFAPLHRFNPTRLAYLRDTAARRFGRDATARRPFAGLSLLDVGCGGGLLSEPMSRLGFAVTGLDASARNIGVARAHAEAQGLPVTYRHATVETLAADDDAGYDVVLAMEVVEHVTDPAAFLRTCAGLLRPGGLMVVATLNRTLRSLALAKIGAEYVLRWLPRGTHDWRQFLTPAEVAAPLAAAGLQPQPPVGVSFDPLGGRWSLSRDTAVNFMVAAEAPSALAAPEAEAQPRAAADGAAAGGAAA